MISQHEASEDNTREAKDYSQSCHVLSLNDSVSVKGERPEVQTKFDNIMDKYLLILASFSIC